MRSRLRLVLRPWLACLAFAGACGGWRGHGDTYFAGRSAPEATYRFDLPGEGWEPTEKLKDVQVAWVHSSIPASIRIHSDCEGHGDSLLPEYLDHLRIGWSEWNVLEQQEDRLVGRESLRALVTAALDGVSLKHEIVLVKKNGCLFDLTYSARPDAFDQARADFHRVVAGFRFPIDQG